MTIEPDTPEALLEQAIEVLLGLLPPQWTVERGQGPAQDDGLSDERFFVKDRGGTGRPILVDARLRPTPAELDKAYNDPLARRMRRDTGSPILVVSRYLSPRSREVLEEAGINYLDLTGLDFAKQAIGFSIFWNSGEMCVAGSRLLVQRSIVDEVLSSLADVAEDWQPGDPLDPATKAGPVVDQSQLDRVLEYVEVARSEGADVTIGGRRVREDSGGYFVEPTVFTGVDNSMRVAQEEIFGPVLAVIPFEDEDEALRIANDTIYGLSASIWTSNLSRAHRFARAVRAGTVWVNNFDQADLTAPFGGFKQSGFGGKDALAGGES